MAAEQSARARRAPNAAVPATSPATASTAGTQPSQIAAPASSSPEPGSFIPLTAHRVIDTRCGCGLTGPISAGGSASARVAGLGGVPEVGAAAVVLNVTVLAPGAGFVAVYPDGAARPTASSISFPANRPVSALVIAGLGPDGGVELSNSSPGSLQVAAYVVGYYISGTATAAGAFASVVPSRLLDTRAAQGGQGPVARGASVQVPITGHGGVPASGVSAVAVTVTATEPTAAGSIAAAPGAAERPTSSSLTFTRGQSVSNLVIVPIGDDGQIQLFNNSTGTVQLAADVTGYFLTGKPSEVGTFVAASTRLLDTRNGIGADGPLAAQAPTSVQVTGQAGLPDSGVSAVMINMSVSGSTATGYLTAYDGDADRPDTWNLIFARGQTIQNLVVVPVGADGSIQLFNGSGGTVQAVGDIVGYYRSDAAVAAPMTWTAPTSIDPLHGNPTSVSCPSTEFCAAVDANGAMFTFDGSVWTNPTSVDVNAYFSSVSCSSASHCVALDIFAGATTFDGTAWSAPVQLGWGSGQSVSCPDSDFCAAVDDSGNAYTFSGGAWSEPVTLDPGSFFAAVSCALPTRCAAVDYSGNVFTYDGTSWSEPTQLAGYLTAVSCGTPTFCLAADYDGNTYRFDGFGWSAPVPGPASGVTSLSCAGANCVVVTSSGQSFTADGSTTGPVATTDAHGSLTSVSCPTVEFCAAVSWDGDALTFDGVTWSPSTAVDLASTLVGVSCGAPGSCIAVDKSGHSLQFDGDTWSAPALFHRNDQLSAVSCGSAAFCAAVDGHGNAFTHDNAGWSGPTATGLQEGESEVSCAGAGFCTAIDGDNS